MSTTSAPSKSLQENYYPVGGGIAVALMIFLLITCIVWITLFSFSPSFVLKCIDKDDSYIHSSRRKNKKGTADPAKCLIAALSTSLVIVVLIWLFRVSA